MKLIIKFFLCLILAISLMGLNFAYAEPDVSGSGKTSDVSGSGRQDPNRTTPSQPLIKLQNPLRVDSIEEVIYLGIDILIYIGVAFAVFAIIFTGFKFVWAQGNPKEIDEAKKRFAYIIIGLAVLISSRIIVQIVRNTLEKAGVVKENTFINPIR